MHYCLFVFGSPRVPRRSVHRTGLGRRGGHGCDEWTPRSTAPHRNPSPATPHANDVNRDSSCATPPTSRRRYETRITGTTTAAAAACSNDHHKSQLRNRVPVCTSRSKNLSRAIHKADIFKNDIKPDKDIFSL